MRLQRFLPISNILLVGLLYTYFIFPQFPIQYQGKYSASTQNTQQMQSPANEMTESCPDVPTQSTPLLDFCAPKDYGKVAGPYGSHILLASENLPPSTLPYQWVLTKDPIADPTLLASCVAAHKNCFTVSAPRDIGQDQKKELYVLTWSGPTFPVQIGSYYLEIVMGNLTSLGTIRIIATTPVAFSLLALQAPCITLTINNNTDDCHTSPQNISIQLTSNASMDIRLNGTNWLLGWQSNSVNTIVEVTATCLPQQHCTTATLFNKKIQVDRNGNFNIPLSLPTNANGTYTITAANRMSPVIHSQQSDFSQPNNNSIADNVLTFGTTQDTQILEIKVLPPLPPAIDASFTFYALGAVLPAVAGILIFFLFWKRQRVQFSKQANGLLSPQQISPLLHFSHAMLPLPQSAHQSEEKKSSNLRITDEFASLPVPLAIVKPNLPTRFRLLPFLKFNQRKEIEQATLQWQQKGKLKKVIDVSSHLLYSDFHTWQYLNECLLQPPSSSQWQVNIVENQARKAMKTFYKAQQRTLEPIPLQLCSKILVYHTSILSVTDYDSMDNAIIQYRLGCAYSQISSGSTQTTRALLEYAKNCYNTAYNIIKDIYSKDTHKFLIIILVSLGDINERMAQLPEQATDVNNDEYLVEALDAYKQALSIVDSPQWKNEIQSKWTAVKKRRDASPR